MLSDSIVLLTRVPACDYYIIDSHQPSVTKSLLLLATGSKPALTRGYGVR